MLRLGLLSPSLGCPYTAGDSVVDHGHDVSDLGFDVAPTIPFALIEIHLP